MDDIESDLSVFHRIDDWASMNSRRFYRLVQRLANYDGSVRSAAIREQEERSAEHSAGSRDLMDFLPAGTAQPSAVTESFADEVGSVIGVRQVSVTA